MDDSKKIPEDNLSIGNVSAIPASNYQVDKEDALAKFSTTLDVKHPEEELNDFYVRVRASLLSKVRIKLGGVKENKIDWSELFLAIGMLFIGIFSNEYSQTTELNESQLFWFLAKLVVGLLCIFGYIIFKVIKYKSTQHTVSEILKEIPDPDKTQ